jgi:hypothetical protein
MAQDDPWKEVNPNDVDFVKQFWPRVFGTPLQDEIVKESLVFKKVCPWCLEEHIRGRVVSL